MQAQEGIQEDWDLQDRLSMGAWLCLLGAQLVVSSLLISPNPSHKIFSGVPWKLGQTHTICSKLTGQTALRTFPLSERENPYQFLEKKRNLCFSSVCHQSNQLLTLLPQQPMQLPCWHSPSSLLHWGQPEVLQTLAIEKSHESQSVLKSSSK